MGGKGFLSQFASHYIVILSVAATPKLLERETFERLLLPARQGSRDRWGGGKVKFVNQPAVLYHFTSDKAVVHLSLWFKCNP